MYSMLISRLHLSLTDQCSAESGGMQTIEAVAAAAAAAVSEAVAFPPSECLSPWRIAVYSPRASSCSMISQHPPSNATAR